MHCTGQTLAQMPQRMQAQPPSCVDGEVEEADAARFAEQFAYAGGVGVEPAHRAGGVGAG